MNKKFYLAGALAVAMSMATPQFAFASDPTLCPQTTVLASELQQLTIGTTPAQLTVSGVKYTIYQEIANPDVMYAFVNAITGDVNNEAVIAKQVDLSVLFPGRKVNVIGFDKTGWEPNTTVKKIEIKDGDITRIDAELFKDFTALETVYVGGKVTVIGARAFAGCTSLSRFGQNEIYSAEKQCRILTKLTSIGSAAFEGTAFEEVRAVSKSNPNGVIDLSGENPWKGCTNLKKFTLASGVDGYKVTDDNILIQIYDNNEYVISYALGADATEAVKIPSGEGISSVVRVLPYAFANNVNAIKTLTVGEWVEPLRDAFENTNATNVVVEGTIDDMSVLKNALSSHVNSETSAYEPVPNANVKSLTINDLQLISGNLVAEQLSALTALEDLTIKSKASSPKFELAVDTSVPATLKTLSLEDVDVNGALYDGATLEALNLKNVKLNACPFVDVDGEGVAKLELALTLDKTNTTGKLNGCKSIVSADLVNKNTADANLFKNCENLATVTWDGTLTTVGANAFLGTQVATISPFNEGTAIQANAFEGTKLTTVDFTNVTSLGAGAFKGCEELASISNCEVADIPASLFEGCTSLETISLTGLNNLANNALKDCSALTTVTLGGVAAVIDQETGTVTTPAVPVALTAPVLAGCDALTSLTLTDVEVSGTEPIHTTSVVDGIPAESKLATLSFDNVAYTADNVAGIPVVNLTIANGDVANNSFEGSTSLKNIVLNNVGNVGEAAFKSVELAANDESVVTVDFSSVDEIGVSAFEGSNLTEIDLENVELLGEAAFKNCTALKTVDYCKVANVPASLFEGCTKLETISLTGLNSLGVDALKGCSALTTVTLGGIAAVEEDTELGISAAPAVPVTLTAPVLAGCDALTSLTLTDVEVSGTEPIHTTSVVDGIPAESKLATLSFDNVAYTAENVANEIASVKDLSIANGDVAELSFVGASLNKLTLENVADVKSSAFKNLVLAADAEGAVAVDLSTVDKVSANAFNGSNLTEVDLSTVASIGDKSFANCAYLTEIELDNTDNHITYLSTNVFKNSAVETATLKNIVLKKGSPAVATTILAGCPVTELNLDGVEFLADEFAGLPIETLVANNLSIPANSFSGFESLTSVDLTGCTSILNGAFMDCTSLATVTGLDLMTIKGQTFAGCSALEAITLGETVENIGTSAFEGTNLTEITLPASVKKIYDKAFAVAGHLATVNVKNATAVIDLPLISVDEYSKPFNEIEADIIDNDNTPLEHLYIVGNEYSNEDPVTHKCAHTISATTLNVPATLLKEYQNAETQWRNFYNEGISENEQSLSWNHIGSDDKTKNGTDFVNANKTTVSKLTFDRTITGKGWYDWYEPFDVTVADLAEQGIEVAQIYNVMATYNPDGTIGDTETTLLCYIVKDPNRIIKANTPYMIRKMETKEDNALNLEFTTTESLLKPVYNYAGEVQGSLIGYTKNSEDGNKDEIILYPSDENSLTANSLRCNYTFQGVYNPTGAVNKIGTDENVRTYAFAKDGGLVKMNNNPIYGQRWYLTIEDNTTYGDVYNNPADGGEARGRINIVETYEHQDEVTSISVIENVIANHPEGIFSIDGRKVISLESAPAGIYIVNGKAVYKK